MRILLDAHVSGRRVGRALQKAGHDVLALDNDEVLSRLPDGEVLARAARDDRIVATQNVSDFVQLARQWAEAGRAHTGMILIPAPRAAPRTILRGLERTLAARPEQEEWVNRVEFLRRG